MKPCLPLWGVGASWFLGGSETCCDIVQHLEALCDILRQCPSPIGNGPKTVSPNTELSEFFGPHRVPGRELSEFLSAYLGPSMKVCQSELTECFAELTESAVKLSEAQ